MKGMQTQVIDERQGDILFERQGMIDLTGILSTYDYESNNNREQGTAG